MADLSKVHRRHIQIMEQTLGILTHLLTPVDQTTATTLRDAQDGPHGWTVLEVLCHLRDFDEIFRSRAALIRDEETPRLPGYDHEVMAVAGAYNQQELRAVLAEFTASRRATVALFEGLSDAQWARAGIHPERGPFSMTDAVMQVGMHDVTHLEQISRILFNNQP